jgi:hypothetical protein
MDDPQWTEIVADLSSLANGRSGSVFTDVGYVQLRPPDGRGEVIEVWACDDGTALVKTGMAFLIGVTFTDEGAVLKVVTAIMDGLAGEIADIAATGQWLGVTSYADPPTGRIEASRVTVPGMAVHHRHERRISPW